VYQRFRTLNQIFENKKEKIALGAKLDWELKNHHSSCPSGFVVASCAKYAGARLNTVHSRLHYCGSFLNRSGVAGYFMACTAIRDELSRQLEAFTWAPEVKDYWLLSSREQQDILGEVRSSKIGQRNFFPRFKRVFVEEFPEQLSPDNKLNAKEQVLDHVQKELEVLIKFIGAGDNPEDVLCRESPVLR